MKTKFTKGIFLLGALTLTNIAFAQDSTRMMVTSSPAPFSKASAYRTTSFGINGGIMAPVMVIGGRNDFTNWETSAGYGGYIKQQLWHNFGIQGDFFKGTLKADNENVTGNNTPIVSPFKSFETEVKYAASISGVYNIGNFTILNRQSFISPYISAGLGFIGYQPTMVNNNDQTIDFNNGDNIRELFVPIGVGTKFMLSKGINLDLGYKMGFVDGDNLDGYHREPQSDRFSYGYAGLEFALGNKTKPQLAFTNPAAVLETGYVAKYDVLKSELDALRAAGNNSDELNALKNQVNKLMTDTDGDGVSDFYDKCPSTPTGTAVDGSGCPLPKMETPRPVTNTYIITEEDKKIVTEAIRNLEFDLAKSTIRSTSYASLNRVAELMISKNLSLKLAGHTDSQGSDAYNMKLSKDRAESVKSYLVSKGVNPSRVEATGYGESQPIDSNATAKGRQNNRRVEFTLFN